jgi:hypothetical protein
MRVPHLMELIWGDGIADSILQNFTLSTETLYLVIQRYIYTCTRDPAGHCKRSYCMGHAFWFPRIRLRGEGERDTN